MIIIPQTNELMLRCCDTVFQQVNFKTEKIINGEEGVPRVCLTALYRDDKNNVLSIEQIVEEYVHAEAVRPVIAAINSLAKAYMVHVLNGHHDITVYLRRIGKSSDPTAYTIIYEPYDAAEAMDADLKWQQGFPYNEVKNGICEPIEQLVGELDFDYENNDVAREMKELGEKIFGDVHIELNGCNSVFTQSDRYRRKECSDDEDDPSFYIQHVKIYRDNKNNVLQIGQFRDEDERPENAPAVLDALPEPVYRYLAELFNKNNDITVYLLQYLAGDPSNVIVVYEPYEVARKMKKRVKIYSVVDPVYVQIKNGVSEPIKALTGFGPYTKLNS